MKISNLLVSSLLVISFLLVPEAVQARDVEGYTIQVVCGGAQGDWSGGTCTKIKPSGDDALDRFPGGLAAPAEFPGRAPDEELATVPYYYLKVNREDAPLFTSLEAAIAGEPVYRYLETGFDFVTSIDYAKVDGKIYYMIAPGIWMQRTGLSRIAPTQFQGLEFWATPDNDFGWVLSTLESKRTPGLAKDDRTGKVYYRYEIVQIYTVNEIDNQQWYLIGADEWVDGRQVARVTPKTDPPEGMDLDRWVEVNLEQQTLAVYDQRQLVFAALVSTGIPGAWTRPGMFQIYLKKEAETMSGAFTADRSDYYYLEDVPWTMYFDQARALHGTYWHNGFGVPRSKGCVNLSPGDAAWIFNWAEDGDWVYVWDPSGETPTDPGLYGPGGS